jgi:hypothetical protein
MFSGSAVSDNKGKKPACDFIKLAGFSDLLLVLFTLPFRTSKS